MKAGEKGGRRGSGGAGLKGEGARDLGLGVETGDGRREMENGKCEMKDKGTEV